MPERGMSEESKKHPKRCEKGCSCISSLYFLILSSFRVMARDFRSQVAMRSKEAKVKVK